MESDPSKIVETIVNWLVPPSCREEVLGDMRERNQGTVQYLAEAACTVPAVIYSSIRRTTDPVVAFMAVVSMYTAFVTSARWLAPELLSRDNGFARLIIPPAISLLAIILADAFSDPKKKSSLKPLFGPTLGLVLTYAVQLNHRSAIPVSVLVWGGALSLLLVSTLRLIFQPVAERPQLAKIPAFWQKLELLPPSFSLKGALLPLAILLATIIFLFIIRS